jgi:hypothetical protein
MTPHEEQLKALQETCIDYIERATDLQALHQIGLDIADAMKLYNAKKDDMTLVTARYLRHQRKLKADV